MNIAKQHLINRTNIRTHNATINKSMINALNEPDLYRFFCLSLYRNSYYNVRLRIEDIAKITGEKKGVLKNFNKSMDTILTRKKYPSPINHPVYEFTMRSLYKIPAMDYKGFITLSHKFTQVKLSVKVKGYYIKLLLIAENNTIPLTNIGIANKLGISKNTVFKYNIELLDINEKDKTIEFRVHCSKGTYIRTLCENIAEKLGTIGYMKELNRVQVGQFNLNQAFTVEELEKNKENEKFLNQHLITVRNFFEKYPIIELKEEKLKLFLNGVQLTNNNDDGLYQIKVNNIVIGIGTIKNKLLKREIIY